MADLEQVYSRYFHDLYRYCLSLCRNEALAEELTQESFCRAMESIDSFRGDCRIFVWLCQIAKNTYFTLCRRQKRCVSESVSESADTALPDLESAYLDDEASRQLHRLLHELHEPYKEVFTLRVFGELPYSRIGALFDMSDSWARLVFYRAKKELWRRLYEHIL